MAKRTYTEHDQARVAVTLQANEGNVKRTARDLDMPHMTVRDWKAKWEREGYPAPVEELLPEVRSEQIATFEDARNLALTVVYEKLESRNVSARDAAWIVGVFTDKIRLIQGQATNRTETVQALPDAKELAKELAAYIAGTVDAAQLRNDEIDDAEWKEVAPAALPRVSQE